MEGLTASPSKVALCFGDKIALRTRIGAGGGGRENTSYQFARHINSSQIPLAVTSAPPGRRVPKGFENCIFQLLSGDGDVRTSTKFLLGTPIHYGQVVRLFHVKTQLLVSCSQKQKAFKQKANYKVSFEPLQEELRGNRWRILPRYRVKGEGEKVCTDDEVVLQLHGSSFYLHTSTIPSEMDEGTDVGPNPTYYEMNCSSLVESPGVAFRIHPYDIPRGPEVNIPAVCCGDCVYLFHKHESGFITAGRRENSDNPIIFIDAQEKPSSHALFLTEFQDALVGGPLKLGNAYTYRLKNLSTGRYLCAKSRIRIGSTKEDLEQIEIMSGSINNSSYEVPGFLPDLYFTIVDDPLTAGTLFSMYPTSDETTRYVHNYARVMVQCVGIESDENPTGWLTCGNDIHDVRRSVIVKEPKTKELSLSDHPVQRDGIQVVIVDSKVFNRLYYVHTMLPPLKICARNILSGAVPSEQHLISAKDSLAELILSSTKSSEMNPFERKGIPDTVFRELLIDQNAPSLCMELVASVFSPQSVFPLTYENLHSSSFIRSGHGIRACDLRDLARLALRLVTLCCLDAPAAGNTVRSFFPLLMKTCTYGIGSMGVLLAVSEACVPMIVTPDDYHLLEDAVNLLVAHPFYPHALELLRRLVYVKEGSGLAQAKTIELLQSNKNVLLVVEGSQVRLPDGETPNVVEWCTDKETDILAESVSRSGTDGLEDPRNSRRVAGNMVHFFSEQLSFLSVLCSGRNAASREFCMKFISSRTLFDLITNQHVVLHVRQAAIRLYRAFEIDVNPYKSIAGKPMAKMWGRLQDDALSSVIAPPTHLKTMQQWCVTYLTARPTLCYTKELQPLNILTKEVIKTLIVVATYGWVTHESQEELVRALINLLKKDSDVFPDTPNFSREELTEYSVSVFNCKAYVVDLLSLLLDQSCEASAQGFITGFEYIFKLPTEKQNKKKHQDRIPHLCSISDISLCPDLSEQSKIKQDKIDERNQKSMLKVVPLPMKGVNLMNISPFGNKIVPAFESKSSLLRDLHYALLEGTLYQDREVAVSMLLLLIRLFNYQDEVYKVVKKTQIILNEHSLHIYQEVCGLREQLIYRAKKPKVIGVAGEIRSILEELETMLPESSPELHERQMIFVGLDIHTIVLKLVREIRFRNTVKERPIGGMLHAAYDLLRKLCFMNKQLCITFFEDIEHHLNHLEYDVGVLELLCVELDENLDLLICLPETFFRTIVSVMIQKDKSPLYALFLRKILWVKEKPVNKLQQLLWKDLMERQMAEGSEKLLSIHDVWTGERGKLNRDEFFATKDDQDPLGNVSFHVQWMSVLWSIVKGKDDRPKRELASLGFQNCGVEDMLEVISNPKLPLYFRSVYIKVFHEVFVDDESQYDAIIDHSVNLKRFLEISLKEIQALRDVVRETSTPPQPLGVIRDLLKSKLKAFTNEEDIEVCHYHVLYCVVQCLRHLMNSVLFKAAKVQPTMRRASKMNILAQVRATLIQIVDAFVELCETQYLFEEGQVGSAASGWVPIPKMSPTRKVAGARRKDVIFPSEMRDMVTFSMQDTSPCLFRMSVRDREKAIALLLEFIKYELYGTKSKEILEKTIALLDKDGAYSKKKERKKQKKREQRKNNDPSVTPRGNVLAQDSDDEKEKDEVVSASVENEAKKDVITAWRDFLDTLSVDSDKILKSLAIHLVATGKRGEKYLSSVIDHLRKSPCSNEDRLKLFTLVQRVLDVKDELRDDDYWILYPDQIPDVMYTEGGSPYKPIYHMNVEERQRHINRVTELASVVIEGSGLADDIANMAIETAISFLDGGNIEVQSTMYSYFLGRRDEVLFQRCRNRIVGYDLMMKARYDDRCRWSGSDSGVLKESVVQKLNAKYDLSIPTRLLRFLQLLVEGHNLKLQDYLRYQFDNMISVDLVEAMTSLLVAILRSQVDRLSLPLCVQVVSTMTEVVQGPCIGNQRRLIGSNVGQSLNILFSQKDRLMWPDLDSDQIWGLRECAVTMLLSLIEGNVPPTLAAELVQTLQLNVLADMMDYSHSKYFESRAPKGAVAKLGKMGTAAASFMSNLVDPSKGHQSMFEDDLNLGVQIFIFFKAIIDMQHRTRIASSGDHAHTISGDEYWASIKDRDGITIKQCLHTHPLYKYFNRLVGSIEILRDGAVEKVYFRLPPNLAINLRAKSRQNLLKDVDRDSQSSKLADFFDRSLDLIYEINFFEELSKTRGMSLIHEYYHHFDTLSLILAFVLNLYLFAFVRYDKDGSYNLPGGQTSDTFDGLSNAAIAIQGCLTLHFLFGDIRIHMAYEWRQWASKKNDMIINESKMNMALEDPVLDRDPVAKLNMIQYIAMSIAMVARYMPFWQRALFMCATVLGNFVHPIFFSIQLLQVIARSPSLQNVVLAVTTNGMTLLRTIGLLCIIVYMFAVIAYYSFSVYVNNSELGDGFNCDTLLKCFFIMIIFGLRQGGGVGDILATPQWYASDFSGRVIFDFLFYCLINVIFLNIVFGIIIDTFAELRGKRDEMHEDQTGKCFICGIDKATIDRQIAGIGGFDMHYKNDHNMWQYLFFFHYLGKKPEDSLNGQESYVYLMSQKKEVGFFPVGRGIMLEGGGEPVLGEDEEEVPNAGGAANTHMERVEQMLSALDDRMASRFNALDSRLRSSTMSSATK